MWRIFVAVCYFNCFYARPWPWQSQNFDDLRIILVKNDVNSTEYIPLNDFSKLLNHPNYDRDLPTIVYSFGFTESYRSKSTQTIVSSYIERGGYNVLVVGWSKYNQGNYLLEVVPRVNSIGETIGKTFVNSKKFGMKLENFHLIGHSLGGHLVGSIGRSVLAASRGSFTIKRITALDPAGPFFYGFASIFNKPISRHDAEFVDVIHTDRRTYGSRYETGTVDFWPNGGGDQPGCGPAGWDITVDENFCSHYRSWMYYAESVRSTDSEIFPAVACKKDGTSAFAKAFMGINADPKLKENYYLTTNAESPFNQGIEGTQSGNSKNCGA